MDDDTDEFSLEMAKCLSPHHSDGDIPEVSSYEDYEHLKAKQKSSILWILSKAYNNEIPVEFLDPYYKDNDEQDKLKPQIVQALTNTEIYCLALTNIYADPNYSCLNHHEIMQLLMRKGIYVVEPNDTSLTETVLLQTAPIRLSAHMVIIDAIMALYIKEVLIPEKVIEVVNRFIALDPEEPFPTDPEEAAIFWLNKSCLRMKQRMDDELFHLGNEVNVVSPPLLVLEDLADLSDGCSLASLLSFYCPDQLNWTEICFNESMGMTDSIYNLQLVQYFCQEKLPHNICFLGLEDFLYLHETIRPNVLAFIADLLYLFEIKPCQCVRRPGTKEELGFSDSEEETFKIPDLPTPAEMKSKSLQHSGWANSDYRSSREESNSQRNLRRSLRRYDRSDDEDVQHHCSMESGVPSDRYPDVIFNKPYDTVSVSNFSKPLTKYKFQELQRTHSAKSKSPTRSEKSDTISDASSVDREKHSPTLTTNFLKISKSKELNGSQLENNSENQTNPVINIAFKQKDANEQSVNPLRASQKPFQLNDNTPIKDLLGQKTIPPNNTEQDKQSENDVQVLLRDIRLKLEAKRHKLETENKNANQAWKQQALLKAVKTAKDDKDVSPDVKESGKFNGSGDNVDVAELKHDLEEMSRRLAEHEKSTMRRFSSAEKQLADRSTDSLNAVNTSQDHQKQTNYTPQRENVEREPSEVPSSSVTNQFRYEHSPQMVPNSPHVAAYNDPQMMNIPKRSKWGQPSVPFAANDLEYQWTVPSIPPQYEHPYYPRFPANNYDMYSMQHMYPPHPQQPRNMYGYRDHDAYGRQPPLPHPNVSRAHPMYPPSVDTYHMPENREFPPFSPPTQHLSYQHNVESAVYPPTSLPLKQNETATSVHQNRLNNSTKSNNERVKNVKSTVEARRDVSQSNQERSPMLMQTMTRGSKSNQPSKRTPNQHEVLSQGMTRKKSVDSEGSSSDSVANKNSSSSDSLSNKDDDTPTFNQKGFFIHLGDDSSPKPKPKPVMRPKLRNQEKPQTPPRVNDNDRENQSGFSLQLSHNSLPKNELTTSPVPQGVGFVIGHDLVNPDPMLELEMAKKKEHVIIQSLRRKHEHEEKRLEKLQEARRLKEEERLRKEEAERKKEEERIRRQMILEQYRQRKCQEEADKNGLSGASSTVSSKDSSRNNTVVLHRPTRGRPHSSGTKPRPKSYHVSASQMQEYASLDPKASRITDDVDAAYNFGSSMNSVGNSCSRPQSALSSNTVPRRLPSPPSRLPAIPPNLLTRHRGPPSDGASDAGSTFSEYTGPKLFVKPTQKSNRGLIINASNVVLAGAVNAEAKKRVLEEINASDSKHFVILFRGAGMQFRAIYSYNPDREEVIKLYGTGPKSVNNDMIDKFYKYNSGTKSFNEVQTKHLTVTIDAFTIHNTLWSGKRMPSKKDIF